MILVDLPNPSKHGIVIKYKPLSLKETKLNLEQKFIRSLKEKKRSVEGPSPTLLGARLHYDGLFFPLSIGVSKAIA